MLAKRKQDAGELRGWEADVWMCGCVYVWMCGCVDVWMCVCVYTSTIYINEDVHNLARCVYATLGDLR